MIRSPSIYCTFLVNWFVCVCPLDRGPPRHGVPGGSDGGPEPGAAGSRRRPRGHHHLLLKKKNDDAFFLRTAPCTVWRSPPLIRVSGHFFFCLRRDEICFVYFVCFFRCSVSGFLLVFFGAGVCRKSGTTCDRHVKDLQNEGKQVAGARPRRATASPHLLHVVNRA